jgi:HSP20 family protein
MATSVTSWTAWPTWTDLTTEIDRVFEQFTRPFDELFAPSRPRLSPSVSGERSARSPIVEVLDQGDHYTVTAELPGFSRDMVDVRVSKTGLMVRARKKEQSEDKRGDSIQRERSDYAFEERVSFPAEVDPKKLAESMKNGVLELKIPKRESPKSEKKTGAS